MQRRHVALTVAVVARRASGPASGGARMARLARAGPRRALDRDTGLLSEWGAGGPPLAWKASGMGAGFSSLAVVEDRIYTMGDRDGAQQLLALSAKDGSLIWKSRVGPVWNDEYGGPRGTPSVDGELV